MRQTRGFSLVESMLAVLVLSLIAVLAMEAAGNSARVQKTLVDKQLADRLADSLLAEITSKSYPGATTPAALPTTRGSYTRIDQYAAFDESPPTFRSGENANLAATWRRTVELSFIDPADPTRTVPTDSGLRRISITVLRDSTVLSQRVALRGRD